MGSMKSILKMLPSVGPFAGMAQAAENVDESQFTRTEAIINSMTNKERQNADLINGSRRKRIAAGSGTSVQEVNNLLRQYNQMSKMFKSMGGGMTGGIKAQQRLMSQMQQQKQRFGR
jgi:signal recognition particle subunit SRP54